MKLIIALMIWSMTLMAQANTLEKIRNTGVITLGYRDANIPFSYLDGNQRPVGYGMDICYNIISDIQKIPGMPKIEIKYQLLTSANRIPMLVNGTIDIECASSTNTVERQKMVSFGSTVFVTVSSFAYKTNSAIRKIPDLKGKTVVGVAGATNLTHMAKINNERNLGITMVSARDRAEAFLMLINGRADAMVDDNILLAGLIANSGMSGSIAVSDDALWAPEPYGFMIRKDDPAFKKAVDSTIQMLSRTKKINALHDKWFTKPIPPNGVNLNFPIDQSLKKTFMNPTDSADPSHYQ